MYKLFTFLVIIELLLKKNLTIDVITILDYDYANLLYSQFAVKCDMTSTYVHRYRNRIDIIAQLLDAASNPTTKTKMMYKAMLSYEQLKEYLVMLTENDLIAYDNPSRRFTTTNKGYHFVKRYEDLNNLIAPLATIVAKE